MSRTKECNWGMKLLTVVSSLVLVLMLGLLAEPFSMVSNAESAAKVIVDSAKIRKEASTGSEVLGSAARNDNVSIRSQVTGSDGMVWYQVFVDADTLGYIRSDLLEITDGTTPPTTTETATNTTTTTVNTNENMPEVTAVNPVSASVTGSQSVRVRAQASTGSQIVTMAQSGLALTVTGQADGNDGKVWYQVTFISNDTTVTGFIRSDYVALNGDLVPVTNDTTEPTVEEPTTEPEVPQEPVVAAKDWETNYVDGKWYLTDNVNGDDYSIDSIFDSVNTNQAILAARDKKIKNQTVGIVLLVILAVAMAGAIAFLVFKIKDMIDSAYFAEVERETIRRRTADRPSGPNGPNGPNKKVMHTVGADRRPTQGGQRPMQNGQRPAGAPAQGGQRPMQNGQRPAGAPAQGSQRPMQNGQRPAGAPVQNGQRPAGAPVQNGQRPAGAPMQNGQRPAGVPVQNGQSTASAPVQNGVAQANRQPAPRPQQDESVQNPGWKSKNFMTDEDEFEFEFLNWDGEEE